MKKINTHLLSTRSVLIFHIAAQERSFTRAAQVMNIGQSAVSHGVRLLEERLGVKLFERLSQGVRLTPMGEQLAKRLHRGFNEIEQGLQEAMNTPTHHRRVTLSISTSLASHWLMPRIALFKQRHPDIQLRCITQDTDQDVYKNDFDLCIPLGQISWQGYQRWQFYDEIIFPVCSPSYLKQQGRIETAEDLLKHPLIHLEEHYAARFNWQKYFQHYELSVDEQAGDETFNDYSIVVQAAVEGQGIALGWKHIVQPLINNGQLISPLSDTICTQQPFYILAPDNKPMRPECKALLEWLLAEIKS